MLINTFIQSGEMYRNATRPAILASIREVLKFYGLSDAFDQVLFNGEAEVVRQVGTSFDSRLRDDKQTEMANRRKLFIVAEVSQSEFNSGYGNTGLGITNPPVWHSALGNVTMLPCYEGREISIEGTSYFRTRNDAVMFINRIQRTQARQLAQFTFDAQIHYPVNIQIINFLLKIHELLTKAGKTQDDFSTWYFKCALAPMDVLTNQANKNPLVVLNRKICDTNIIFDPPRLELSRRGDRVGQHMVTFRYRYYWQDMVEWQLNYPMMVQQQPIPEEFVPKIQESFEKGFIKNAPIEYQQMNLIDHRRTASAPYYKRYPAYDPWYPPKESWLDTQLTVLTALDNVQQQVMFNLKELPEWEWVKPIYEHMIKYRAYLFDRHEDIIHIKVYSDDLQVRFDQIRLEENGDVVFLRPPTMSAHYRFVLYVDLDLRNLSGDAIDRIVSDPDLQKHFLPTIFPWHKWDEVPNVGYNPDREGTGRWPDGEVPIRRPGQDAGNGEWIGSRDDWYDHTEAGNLGPDGVRFTSVFHVASINTSANQ